MAFLDKLKAGLSKTKNAIFGQVKEVLKAFVKVDEELLDELGASGKPVLYVYNKCDLLPDFPESGIKKDENKIYISAESGAGLTLLLEALEAIVLGGKERVTLFFTYAEQGRISALHSEATVEAIEYGEEGVLVTAVLDEKCRGRYASNIRHE